MLILASGSNGYGGDGTIYGTEKESFSRITSLVSAISNQIYFKVETKDGNTLEYGNTSDSYLEASTDQTALTWLLDKVTDCHSNFMKIHYTVDNTNGEIRPDYIEYTGNENTGLTPYNQVKFVYGARSDKQFSYVGGMQTQQNVLLVGIEMYAQGIKMHEYDFNYSFDMGSHLSEVIEKGADGKQYNSTKFSWDSNYNILPVENPLSYFDGKSGDYLSADVNGDGFADVIKLDLNNWNLYQNNFLATGNVSFSPPTTANNTGVLDPNITYVYRAFDRMLKHNGGGYDLNGDGYDDLLVYLPETGGMINTDVLTSSGYPNVPHKL